MIASDKIATQAANISVGQLVVGYLEFALGYYVKNGRVTDEVNCIRLAVHPLVKLYADTSAADFGPLKLKATRQEMIDSGKICRRFIKQSVGRIRRIFRWANLVIQHVPRAMRDSDVPAINLVLRISALILVHLYQVLM